MARRAKFIADPDSPQPTQYSLFLDPNLKEPEKRRFNPYPRISRNESDIAEVLSRSGRHVHLDLEFRGTGPTILGVANDDLAVSIPWSSFRARQVVDHCLANGKTIVAFSTVGADKKELDKALGITTPLSLWEDSMLTHYLDNAILTKQPGKDEGDDESESGSLGLMNLGTAAMIYTDLPMWKHCRGIACEGPCPAHKETVWGYNAVDSWAGGQIFYRSVESMGRKGIPFQFYRELLELSELCDLMQTQGILVDRKYVRDISKKMEEGKSALFPFTRHGSKDIYDGPFNPKSSKQIIEYFWKHRIELTATDKDTIDTTLERECRKNKIPLGTKQGKYDALSEKYGLYMWSSEKECQVTSSDDNDTLLHLFRLYLFKNSGKGVDSWFDDKYLDFNNRLHPRYSVTGTCTGRLSSGSPNFQNVAKHSEFGKALRRAIIPDPGYRLVESDYSSLEFRDVLWLSGMDPSEAGKDVFLYLISKADGQLDSAAAHYGLSVRQVAKSAVYGSQYNEGIDVLYPRDFTSRIKKEIEYGARRLYKDWELGGGVVSFTGANLAERLFGDKSWENRKKALEIQDIFFRTFPMIRAWQKKATQTAEEQGYVQSPTGRYLPLIADPADNAKKVCAFLGQGVGADHTQAVMLRMKRELGVIPIGQIHDAIITQVPLEWSDERIRDHMGIMEEETWRLPGLKVPIKTEVGLNWAEMSSI
jgi:hypothetical protein